MAMTRKRLFRIGFYGGTGMIFLCMLLDPYSRQSIFGPKIQGEPLCYRQQEFRRGADSSLPQEPAMMKALAFLGIKSPANGIVPLDHANTLLVALNLIDDPSPTVRAAVARSLGWYAESPDAIEGLLRLLDDTRAEVRLAAAESCVRIGPKAARGLAGLQQLLDDEDLSCRVFAAWALVESADARDKKTLTILLDGLNAPNGSARFQAAGSLCRFGKEFPECFPDVAAAARKDRWARTGFADHASEFGPIAIPLLIELLGDIEDSVSSRAVLALGKMGPTATPAIPALVRAQSSPGPDTRNFAYEALSKIDPMRYPQRQAEPR